MCGRYSIGDEIKELAQQHDYSIPSDFDPTYNAAPGQSLPVLSHPHPNAFSLMHWGIQPFWAKDQSKRLINARAETVAEKASFKKSFQQRRCLIAADGYYEWMKTPEGKVPYRITRNDAPAFLMAGIWDKDHEGQPAFAIITTQASESITHIHDRMPVLLHDEALALWQSDTEDYPGLVDLLRPFDDDRLEAFTVSKKVNWVGNNEEYLRKAVD